MQFSKDKSINRMVQELIRQNGWWLKKGKRHLAVVSPAGAKLPVPGTPSDWRASRNFKSEMNKLKHGGLHE